MTKKLSIGLPLIGLAIVLVWIKVSARTVPHVPPLVEPASSPYAHTIAATGIVEASERNYNLNPPISGQIV